MTDPRAKRSLRSRLGRLALTGLLALLPASLHALTSWEIHDLMGVGINYGEHFESKSQKTNLAVAEIPQSHIDAIWAAGFRHIRIPVTWGYRLNDNQANPPDITVNDGFMTRVRNSVDRALAKGFVVILNVHHDFDTNEWGAKTYPTGITNVTGYPRSTGFVLAEIWRDIAQNFQGRDRLVFEILNEPPQTFFDKAKVNEINDDIYDVIKSSPGQTNRVVMLSVHHDNSPWSLADCDLPTGATNANVIKTIHHYNPYTFCAAGPANGQTTGTWNDWPGMNSMFTTIQNNDGGAPVNMGEFGVGHMGPNSFHDTESVLRWYQAATSLAEQYDVTATVWCDAGWFRVFNRGAGNFDFAGDVRHDEIWKTVTLLKNQWRLVSRADGAKSFSTAQNNTGDFVSSALHTTNGSWSTQKLRFSPANQYGYFLMRNAAGKYIGTTGATSYENNAVRQESGTLLQDADRHWRLRVNNSGFHYLNPRNDGARLLDTNNGSTAAGTPLVLRTAAYTSTQQWELVLAP